jgi:hypothetical protein
VAELEESVLVGSADVLGEPSVEEPVLGGTGVGSRLSLQPHAAAIAIDKTEPIATKVDNFIAHSQLSVNGKTSSSHRLPTNSSRLPVSQGALWKTEMQQSIRGDIRHSWKSYNSWGA